MSSKTSPRKILNPKTGRLVNMSGRIGKRLSKLSPNNNESEDTETLLKSPDRKRQRKIFSPRQKKYVSTNTKTGKALMKLKFEEDKKDIPIERKRRYFFDIVKPLILQENIDIKSLKTSNGDTQVSERIYIRILKNIFERNEIEYTSASSQRAIDFQNVGPNLVDIEVKKTNESTIMFNDTLPKEGVFYIVFSVKHNKILFIEGSEFVKDSPWIYDYIDEINKIKTKFCVGRGKRQGCMRVYARPNFSADLSIFL